MNERKLALFMDSGEPGRLRLAANLATSAALLGWEVVVIWTGDALTRLVAGRIDEGAAAGQGPSELLAEARALQPVTYLACSADSARLGRPREELLRHVDDIVAMATILRRIQDAATKLIL